MYSKKGISAIVATVLIVLFTIAAVAIIWVAVIPMITEKVSFHDPNLRLDLVTSEGYTTYDSDLKLMTVQISRGSDESDLLGFDLIFNIDGNSVKHFISDFPEPNQVKVYYINLSNYSSVPTSIKVAPVFTDGEVGIPISEFKVEIPEVTLEPLVNGSPDDGEEEFKKPNGGYSGGGGGGSSGGGTTTPPCTSNLVNTSWSDWVNQTECRVNNTLLQNQSIVQYDSAGCVGNVTYWNFSELDCVYTAPTEPEGLILTSEGLEQYGIIWFFDKNLTTNGAEGTYQYGTFVNGDYWVKTDEREIVNVTGITPGWDGEKHGSMINPIPQRAIINSFYQQGYDVNLTQGLVFNLSLTAIAPLAMSANQSLISVESDTVRSNRPLLKNAAVLTVLGEVPPDSGTTVFRPPYAGNEKSFYSVNDLNLELLPNLEFSGSLPEIDSILNQTSRPWIDHFNSLGDGTQYTSPLNNMPNFGNTYSTLIGETSLLLMAGGVSSQQKQNLTVNIVQIGIDNYWVLETGGFWVNNGGLNSGRKWPIIFAGLLLNDSDMKGIGQRGINLALYGRAENLTESFAEDSQTFYVGQTEIEVSSSWDPSNGMFHPDSRDCTLFGYPADLSCPNWMPYNDSNLGLPEWGITHDTDPLRSNKFWDTYYRQNQNGMGWQGITLAVNIMNATKYWNQSAFIDYEDRYMEIMEGTSLRSWSSFNELMWDSYRGSFGCTWTRDNPSDSYSNGHYNCSNELIRCSWQNSSVGTIITSCGQYPSQRAIDYDPCNLGCN